MATASNRLPNCLWNRLRGPFPSNASLPPSPAQALYGGGQYQNGLLQYRHFPLDLLQYNTEAAVPFFVSTAGYGLLWDNYARTRLNPGTPVPLAGPVPGPSGPTWTAQVTTGAPGLYHFALTSGFWFGMRGRRLWLDVEGTGQRVIAWEGLGSSPSSHTGRVALAGHTRYTLRVVGEDPDMALTMTPPDYGRTTLRSDAGEWVDYYAMVGGSLDGTIALYREATGPAPLYGRWAYGFWQCKEHYASQEELLGAAKGYRARGIPVDNIVQDWHYWGDLGWGPQWDPKVYPDPAAMVRQLHAMHLQLMVSVWSRFDNNTKFWRTMAAGHHLIGGSTYFDPYDRRAREQFFAFVNESMFSIGGPLTLLLPHSASPSHCSSLTVLPPHRIRIRMDVYTRIRAYTPPPMRLLRRRNCAYM